MANDSANISFLIDGSCKLEYYPTDSISSGQLEILRGTWARQKDTFQVNWLKNDHQENVPAGSSCFPLRMKTHMTRIV